MLGLCFKVEQKLKWMCWLVCTASHLCNGARSCGRSFLSPQSCTAVFAVSANTAVKTTFHDGLRNKSWWGLERNAGIVENQLPARCKHPHTHRHTHKRAQTSVLFDMRPLARQLASQATSVLSIIWSSCWATLNVSCMKTPLMTAKHAKPDPGQAVAPPRAKQKVMQSMNCGEIFAHTYLPGSSNARFFLVAAVVAHFCSESTTKSSNSSLPKPLIWLFLEELYINDHQCVDFLICGPECLNPAIGFHKFVSKRGDYRKHAKIRD